MLAVSYRTGLNGAVVLVLRAQREASGLTQAEVARRADIPEVSVQRLLAGTRAITLETLESLCGALCVLPHDVVAEAERERAERAENEQVDLLWSSYRGPAV